MKIYPPMLVLMGFALSAALASCGSDVADQRQKSSTAGGTEQAALVAAPSPRDVANTTYLGIYEEPVRLTDGRFEGKPFVAGGASRPSVTLIEDAYETGDLDGDGNGDAVVLLAESSGGSGSNIFLAVVGHRDGEIVNLGTSLVGDRVQIRSFKVGESVIELKVVQQGPSDAACCPSQKATRIWVLDERGLVESSSVVTGTLSVEDLSGVEWVLTQFDWNEPAPESPSITLKFEDGTFVGSSGCNHYFAGVTESSPGTITIDEVVSTRMGCPNDHMQLEDRYLKTIQGVMTYRFLVGKLALTCREGETLRTLLYSRRR